MNSEYSHNVQIRTSHRSAATRAQSRHKLHTPPKRSTRMPKVACKDGDDKIALQERIVHHSAVAVCLVRERRPQETGARTGAHWH